jgi:hypothetical protein
MLDTVTHPSRIHCVKFYKSAETPDQDVLLVAAEDKFVTAYLVGDGEQSSRIIARFGGHTNRYVMHLPKRNHLLIRP